MTYPEITNCETCPLKDLCIEKEYFVTCAYMRAKRDKYERHRKIRDLCIILTNICGFIMFIFTVNEFYFFLFGYSQLITGCLLRVIIFMICYAGILFSSLMYLVLFLGGELR